MKFRYSWFGAALVVVGAALLLDRMGLIALGWSPVLWSLVAVAGASKIVSGFAGRRKGAMFWGSFLLVLGSMGVLDWFGVIMLRGPSAFGLLLIAAGAGLALIIVRSPRDWHLAVPAIFFAGAGTLFMLAAQGYISRWEIQQMIGHYWPAALILFGASLLINRKAA